MLVSNTNSSHVEMGLCLSLLLSIKNITVPPIRAITPLTIKMVATSIPENAKPRVMPMLLIDSLIAVWLTLSADLITFLVVMFVGIEPAKEASEDIASPIIIRPASTSIPPPINMPGPRRNLIDCYDI